ncbi:TPA: hypothetical protein N0F65_001985 [Lagenidium giganteum]|uniref:Tubulin delta chain n=1 Tax=Lagenidium giganteum TaxID=4803 RepID=A0AAV2Z3C8_9STRA|nr:TPA: hypothetical protein N0F65_001985 [Lagenidium giganteum]
MSVLVHVGQCGNQVGDAFWSLVADATTTLPAHAATTDNAGSGRPPRTGKGGALTVFHRFYFHPTSHMARCVLVDSEPKVIRAIIHSEDKAGRQAFKPAHAHYEQSGRGNNWAMGYNFQRFQLNVLPSSAAKPFAGMDDDRMELIDLVMESLRKEIEAVDVYEGAVVTHSLGGGTGAGLGCRVIERMRDSYPKTYVVTTSVAPSMACGDTPLQNYNAVFTLACLQEHVDCVVLKDNDDLLRTALQWKNNAKEGDSPTEASSSRVSLQDLNYLVASDLAGLLFPRKSGGRVERCWIGDLVHDLCPLRTAKFIDVRTGINVKRQAISMKHGGKHKGVRLRSSIPVNPADMDNSTDQLVKLGRRTFQSFPRILVGSGGHLGCRFVTRYDAAVLKDVDEGRLTDAIGYLGAPPVPWTDNPIRRVETATSAAPFETHGGIAAMTVAMNNGHGVSCIRHFRERAQRQFQAKAYTHWYHQYGIEDDKFQEAFEQCANVIADYEDLLR